MSKRGYGHVGMNHVHHETERLRLENEHLLDF